MGVLEGIDMEHWSDGRVMLTVPEAAKLWRNITGTPVSAAVYRTRCRTGWLREQGVVLSAGPAYMTDMDSLLTYFDRINREVRERIDEALEERRRALGK